MIKHSSLAKDIDDIALASNGFEAYQWIITEEPDIIFMDINMPRLTGIEIMEKVQDLKIQSAFIIVSGYDKFTYAQRALQLKAHDYLLKPIQEEKLLKVLAEVIHEKKQEEKRRPEEVYGTQETLVQDILKILYAQVANADFSLQELSKSLHVSSSYLSRYLKKETGLTFSELLTKLRMEVAVTLLESHPKMTILEVSERSGFKNQHYFSKVFRTVIGQTPSDYKKQFL